MVILTILTIIWIVAGALMVHDRYPVLGVMFYIGASAFAVLTVIAAFHA